MARQCTRAAISHARPGAGDNELAECSSTLWLTRGREPDSGGQPDDAPAIAGSQRSQPEVREEPFEGVEDAVVI